MWTRLKLCLCTFLVCFPTSLCGTNSSKPTMFMCGYLNPTRYDPLYEQCKDGEIFSKIPTTPYPLATMATSSRVNSTANSTVPGAPVPYVEPCRRWLECQGERHCASPGTKCCGTQTFLPSHQTCCMPLRYKWTIHDDKPARKHICCGLEPYARNKPGGIPCQHPVKNNRFWTAPIFNKRNLGQHCKNNQNAAIVVLQEVDDDRHYVAHVISMTINRTGNPPHPRQLKVPIDQHKRRRNLDKQTFLILSPADPLQDAVDLILNSNDVILRLPKRLKKRKRLLKKCGIPFKRVLHFRRRAICERTRSRLTLIGLNINITSIGAEVFRAYQIHFDGLRKNIPGLRLDTD